MELSQETIFCDIKDCLLFFNYPLAHCMDDNELADVFHASNRCFLVSWMLKLYLGDVYQDNVTVKEGNAGMLGDLLHELGFCMKKQKLSFMKGDLDLDAQIEILYKMFKSIKSVKSSEHKTNQISCDEIMLLSTNELNLFPMYGDIKTSNYVDTDCNDTEEKHLSVSGVDTITNEGEHIESLMDQVQEELAKMESVCRNIPETTNNIQQDLPKIVYDPDSSNILGTCVGHAKQISQLLDNLNTIEKLREYNNISKKEWTGIEHSQDMLRALYEEIVVTLRYQQMKLP